MRLIGADALIEAISDLEQLAYKRCSDTPSVYGDRVNPAYIRYSAQAGERTNVREMVMDAPTVDAVPVIRCKDCFYYQTGNYGMGEWRWCMVHHDYTKDDNYCSWAERREE